MSRGRRFASSLLAAGLLATAAGCGSSGTLSASSPAASVTANSGFDGAAFPPGRVARAFALSDQSGHRVSLAEYRGRPVILAFLYSTCGRVCVLVAQQIRGALEELPRPVPVLLVSADPSADSRSSIAAFLARVSLKGRARYLSGPLALLRPLWRAYRVTPPERDRAAFENAISVLLIDAGGDERVLFQLEELTPEALVHDLRRLGAG